MFSRYMLRYLSKKYDYEGDDFMSFKELDIKPEYRSPSTDVVKDFYIPILKEAVLYKRAVGFFSSTAFAEATKGITGLIRNGGKIMLIASPRLQQEDINAIEKGYEERSKVVERVLMSSFIEPCDYFETERLNLLATLIADGKLDIKIALTESSNKIGMYHEKMGLFYDNQDNVLAFTGSMNETMTAFNINYETIDVFRSWTNEFEFEKVKAKENAFTALWNDFEPNVSVIDFPDVAKEKLMSYKKETINLDIDEDEFRHESKDINAPQIGPHIPVNVKLHDYQLEAIEQWNNMGFKGIFDMATGTGKTFTGLGAISRLFEHCDKKLAVVIVCPYQHLVEQWIEDILLFNMRPIVGYSASSQKDWKKRLKDAIFSFNLGVKEHFCFITTNATFSSDYVRQQIDSVKGNVVLMVDEAHNFGAQNLSATLNIRIPYRLALSATLERHGDQEGTDKLYNYFGEKCIEYTLERAIREGKLTPYRYYPVQVHLTENELKLYKDITKELAKYCTKDRYGKMKIGETGKMLLIKRARVVAAASEKITKLKQVIEPFVEDKHMLVYCGAASMSDPEYSEGNMDSFERRQIDVVSDLLGNQLGMRISKFTSEESAEERVRLKIEFQDADHIQALVAIRCLDEGVNIPSIKLAFILASSTNPKEYVQRRGRVLRKAKDKNFATIYDFITLPRPLEDVLSLSAEEIKVDISLVNREMVRMKDFAAIAENPSDTDSLINQIEEAYGLYKIGGDGDVI